MTSLLILTVGTGTAEKHSDVAQGLANTIRQVQPRKFWLVPSASEKSILVADLIRETVVDLDSFAPWSESTPYYAIPNHDDIHECRRLGDLLAGADELLRCGDCEEALARYYRGAEHTAKVRLAEAHAIRPPYLLEALLNLLPPGCRLADELRSRTRVGGLQLGSDIAWRILEVAQDPMANAYFGDSRLQGGLRRRNESMYGHGQEPVAVRDVQAVADRFRNLLRTHLPAVLTVWSTARRPGSLPSTS